MENLDTGTLENWYANRAMPTPTQVQRLAVIAPDDAPGLATLRLRLAQRGPQSLNCDHFAAGFDGAARVSLVSAFEQIRQRHATDPYDIVLLLEGRPEALGIAESNGLIPEQVSRMPVAVWTAIGEDDANTELGDVANRVFANPAALIDALPLRAMPATASTAIPAPSPSPEPGTVAAPVFSLVIEPNDAVPAHLLTLPSRHVPIPPTRASAHPLVLCAAGAVIVASMTAVAAMLGWLPSRMQTGVDAPGHAATAMTSRTPAAVAESPATAPPDKVVNVVEALPAASTAGSVPEPEIEAAPSPAAPQSSGVAEDAALAAAGTAGLIAAAPRGQAPVAQAKKVRRTPRRQSETLFGPAQAPRQVGSTEVPVVEFVGTKSREQVIAEMVEARRAANRQAANGNYFPGLGGPSVRR